MWIITFKNKRDGREHKETFYDMDVAKVTAIYYNAEIVNYTYRD